MSTERIQHSKEEWEQIEAERRKAEDEAFAKRKAQGEIVSASPRYVVCDSFGIHPDDQIIIQKCIERINQHYRELVGLPKKARDLLFEIGAELLDLKEPRVWSLGRWRRSGTGGICGRRNAFRAYAGTRSRLW